MLLYISSNRQVGGGVISAPPWMFMTATVTTVEDVTAVSIGKDASSKVTADQVDPHFCQKPFVLCRCLPCESAIDLQWHLFEIPVQCGLLKNRNPVQTGIVFGYRYLVTLHLVLILLLRLRFFFFNPCNGFHQRNLLWAKSESSAILWVFPIVKIMTHKHENNPLCVSQQFAPSCVCAAYVCFVYWKQWYFNLW